MARIEDIILISILQKNGLIPLQTARQYLLKIRRQEIQEVAELFRESGQLSPVALQQAQQQVKTVVLECSRCQQKYPPQALKSLLLSCPVCQTNLQITLPRPSTAAVSGANRAVAWAQNPRILIGQTIEYYQILDLLGQGGMGCVYLVQHQYLARRSALKLLHPGLWHHHDIVERFLREARILASLHSSNIVQVYHMGKWRQCYYIEMELVQGESLAKLLKRKGRLDIEEAVQILQQVCLGLAAAHTHGVIHRDIKPANVLLQRNGQAKVVDFGLARLANSSSSLSRPGQIMGTPHYMSPEQACGRQVDHTTDIYSLGIMFYQMLTGQVPLDASTPLKILYCQVHDEPLPIRQVRAEIPSHLAGIVHRMLAKQSAQRYESVAALQADLELYQTPTRLADPRATMSKPRTTADQKHSPRQTNTDRKRRGSRATIGGKMSRKAPQHQVQVKKYWMWILATALLLGVSVLLWYYHEHARRIDQRLRVHLRQLQRQSAQLCQEHRYTQALKKLQHQIRQFPLLKKYLKQQRRHIYQQARQGIPDWLTQLLDSPQPFNIKRIQTIATLFKEVDYVFCQHPWPNWDARLLRQECQQLVKRTVARIWRVAQKQVGYIARRDFLQQRLSILPLQLHCNAAMRQQLQRARDIWAYHTLNLLAHAELKPEVIRNICDQLRFFGDPYIQRLSPPSSSTYQQVQQKLSRKLIQMLSRQDHIADQLLYYHALAVYLPLALKTVLQKHIQAICKQAWQKLQTQFQTILAKPGVHLADLQEFQRLQKAVARLAHTGCMALPEKEIAAQTIQWKQKWTKKLLAHLQQQASWTDKIRFCKAAAPYLPADLHRHLLQHLYQRQNNIIRQLNQRIMDALQQQDFQTFQQLMGKLHHYLVLEQEQAAEGLTAILAVVCHQIDNSLLQQIVLAKQKHDTVSFQRLSRNLTCLPVLFQKQWQQYLHKKRHKYCQQLAKILQAKEPLVQTLDQALTLLHTSPLLTPLPGFPLSKSLVQQKMDLELQLEWTRLQVISAHKNVSVGRRLLRDYRLRYQDLQEELSPAIAKSLAQAIAKQHTALFRKYLKYSYDQFCRSLEQNCPDQARQLYCRVGEELLVVRLSPTLRQKLSSQYRDQCYKIWRRQARATLAIFLYHDEYPRAVRWLRIWQEFPLGREPQQEYYLKYIKEVAEFNSCLNKAHKLYQKFSPCWTHDVKRLLRLIIEGERSNLDDPDAKLRKCFQKALEHMVPEKLPKNVCKRNSRIFKQIVYFKIWSQLQPIYSKLPDVIHQKLEKWRTHILEKQMRPFFRSQGYRLK